MVVVLSKTISPSLSHPPSPHPFLPGSFSIKSTATIQTIPPSIAVEVKSLNEEDLKQYWDEAAEKLGIVDIMKAGMPCLGEQTGLIEVDAQTVSFSDEFKPHKIEVMEFLRDKTGMKMLDCKVNPRYIEKTEVIYSPEDKYKAMLAANPSLVELRKLFPNIDY